MPIPRFDKTTPRPVSIFFTVLLILFFYPAGAWAADDLSPSAIFSDDDLLFSSARDWLSSDLRVELRAPSMVALSASAPGRLALVAVKDGEEVRRGQLLIQIDDRLARLRLEAAEAARYQAATQLRSVEKLYELDSRGILDVEMARARFREARAAAELASAIVDLHRITAPWDGRVTQLEVRANQHVPEGTPLLELAESGLMELEFMMPSTWLGRLRAGNSFEVKVDETGRSYGAEVLRLGGKIDSVTQSIKVYGRLREPASELLPGMSGVLIPPEVDQP